MFKTFLCSLKNQARRQEGFTLVGTLIIGLMLLILIMSFASYQYQTKKQIQSQANRSNVSQLQNNLVTSNGQTDSASQTESLQASPAPSP
jgi:Tfp pilus assembly protein PilV